jgi:hypothetical protein
MPPTTWNKAWALLILILATASSGAPQDGLPAAEFSRLIGDLSEEGGYFTSDNFTSNEDSYLTVLDTLKEFGAAGGAYIGVGPEQNFTYIAKIRPKIAFIVDIRRQAMIQHLMYKAIFHRAPTRADFLSLLLSRPLDAKAPGADASINELVDYFSRIPADEKTYAGNLDAIVNTIQQDFQFPLTGEDRDALVYIYRNFRLQGLDIGYSVDDEGSRRFGRLPSLKDLLVQKDLHGNPGNFLAAADDYNFVRSMQEKNLIIPVVGDFGGKKALAAVGDYLKKHGYCVSVFYLSNVELVLFEFNSSSTFPDFVANVKKLPVDSHSLFIRSTYASYRHPSQLPGYTLCSSVQNISTFLKEYDAGRYKTYRDLIK